MWKYLDAMSAPGGAAASADAGASDGSCWQALTGEATKLVSPSVGKVRAVRVRVCYGGVAWAE